MLVLSSVYLQIAIPLLIRSFLSTLESVQTYLSKTKGGESATKTSSSSKTPKSVYSSKHRNLTNNPHPHGLSSWAAGEPIPTGA